MLRRKGVVFSLHNNGQYPMAARRERLFATHGMRLSTAVNQNALRDECRTLVLQLRQEIGQVEELSLRCNLPLLVELEDADAVQEEDIAGLGLKT